MASRILVASDIHGCHKTFEHALDSMGLTRSDQLFLLGDFIDRGPGSKQLIDTILDIQENGFQITCLRGNHEQLLLDGIHNQMKLSTWLRNGGLHTLESFGCTHPKDIDQHYLQWMKNLAFYHEIGDYILVHAGLDMTVPDPFEEKNAMIWIRPWEVTVNQNWLNDRTIVHGHTPQNMETILECMNSSQRPQLINIDNGCCLNRPGYHALCWVDLTSGKVNFTPNSEKIN